MSYKTGGQGKGDEPRPINKEKYDKNFQEAFNAGKCDNCRGYGRVRLEAHAAPTECEVCKGTGKI
ncbi:MAG: hypothetical protein ACHQ1D_00705 [Nitrososphaerales archaeon]